MALSGTWAMCEEKNTSGKSILGISVAGPKKLKRSKITESVMEFESHLTKRSKLSAFTAQEIRFATSIMPWSCRIPISEGFYEFL
ncbi:hypothetical protein CDL12_01146 [Handroanthus impetiginosus]|uniref:Uncharacterized protein n=1 Tax=Handroanthus impetiginosus TaxID=429701 RepID=A0A2G9I8N7_9LAMI|nr:hypothetical protein CDL12_01146 [Handroanthus impetiginosus]